MTLKQTRFLIANLCLVIISCLVWLASSRVVGNVAGGLCAGLLLTFPWRELKGGWVKLAQGMAITAALFAGPAFKNALYPNADFTGAQMLASIVVFSAAVLVNSALGIRAFPRAKEETGLTSPVKEDVIPVKMIVIIVSMSIIFTTALSIMGFAQPWALKEGDGFSSCFATLYSLKYVFLFMSALGFLMLLVICWNMRQGTIETN